MGAVFWVSRVNHELSVVVMVRPSGCWYTSPTSKSSKNRPRQPSFIAIRRYVSLCSLDCALCAQPADLLVGVADGAEDLFGVFAHCRNRVHARRRAAHDDWRQQGSDRPVGRVNLPPALARRQLLMVPKL